ncbi:MAG: DUF885 domain-containing protein, partial [Coriobacteriales bacterium]|nr:DUF885 domain-containing protein [Coriobacteriales bacterium]
ESYTKEAAHNVIVASFETSLASNAKPFSELTQQQRDDYAAKHRTIVEKQVIPAYLTTIALLEELYAKANDTASLADLPNSKAYYAARMNYYGFSETPEDAIKTLDKKLDEYWDVLLSPPVGMTEPAQWSARALRVLGEDATDIVSFYNKKAKEDFPDIGMRPFVVDAASDDETIDKIMAFYMFAPVDDLDDNRIIFYPRNISDHFTLGSTLAHEAFPGHLYQYNYFGMKNPHPVELVFGSTAYDEGYAVYVQEYGSKYMGFNEKEIAYLTAYELYMRGLQARIDLGVNYEGWSVKETGKFLRAWGMEAFAKEIYEEIAAVPLLSLPYGLAPITFFDAREAAQKALGSAFDLKDFHAMLLDDGSVPLWTLDKKIAAYIGADAGAADGSGASTGQTEKKAA